jgi:hypothetical protein
VGQGNGRQPSHARQTSIAVHACPGGQCIASHTLLHCCRGMSLTSSSAVGLYRQDSTGSMVRGACHVRIRRVYGLAHWQNAHARCTCRIVYMPFGSRAVYLTLLLQRLITARICPSQLGSPITSPDKTGLNRRVVCFLTVHAAPQGHCHGWHGLVGPHTAIVDGAEPFDSHTHTGHQAV